MFEALLSKAIRGFFSCFSNLVNKFHMAYHGGCIGKGIAFHRCG